MRTYIINLIFRFGRRVKSLLMGGAAARDIEYQSRILNGAACAHARLNSDVDVCGIVFSMDRAMQLHSLLSSYKDNAINAPKLKVIYRTTSAGHERAYTDVFSECKDVVGEIIKQESRESFRTLLIAALSNSVAENVFFLVDDNMLIESVDVGLFSRHATAFTVPTLRMGENLVRSYTVQRDQPKPELMPYRCDTGGSHDAEELLSWRWGNGLLDWAYPLSVDGHVFRRQEILALAEVIDFNSPNTFEGTLQEFSFAYQWRLGVCYRKSKLINIPYNRVQSDFENIHGEIHQDEMLGMWEDGYRIDRASYYGFVNESAHQELPLRLRKVESK